MQIVHSAEVPSEGVRHHPEILKKVFIKKGEVPGLMNFSSAVFRPGDSVELHKHETMTEVFYITSGAALFCTDAYERKVCAGDVVWIPAGEPHRQSNPFEEDVSWLYFGISADDDSSKRDI